MVEHELFNKEATISTPATNIVKVLFLQRRNDFFEALESYHGKNPDELYIPIDVVKARLFTWFMEMQSLLKRKWEANKYNQLIIDLKSNDELVLLDIAYAFNDLLDELKITQLDTKKQYDVTDAEIENQEKGL